MGPTLSFRGIDNAAYYRLAHDDRSRYVDYTGCGNTLNMTHPRTLQIIMDSLRYWVQEMHVDGFRFDLAAALARELHEVDRLGAFFDIIHQDPVLSQVKLIAEPWDLGEGGYQVGNFPVLWAEWNGVYRDAVRGYWRGDAGLIDDLAYRLTGSSDLYERSGRRPYASVNFVTCHDGFTLNDLVSYNRKHNEDNLEGNRDGHDHNLSYNFGVEGPTDDPDILEQRARQRRNLLATLLLSQGVPMLCAGDEIARTQAGNNNAYCQDNEVSWLDWRLDEEKRDLLEFTRLLIRLFHTHPVLRRRKFFQGRKIRGSEVKDLTWLRQRRARDDRARLARRLAPLSGLAPRRRRHRRSGRARQPRHRRHAPHPDERRAHARALRAARTPPARPLGTRPRHARADRQAPPPAPPARRLLRTRTPLDGAVPPSTPRGAVGKKQRAAGSRQQEQKREGA